MKHLYYLKNSVKFKGILYILFLIHSTHFATAGKIDSLFQSDELLKIELRADFSAIQNDRAEDPGYHDGELIYYSPNGEPTLLPVRVMARGNFRRDPVNCKFPPLMVNFKKNNVKKTLFEDQDKLKLVTPCQNDEDVLEEYIIYKMYNEVTDLSMKVRLAEILYFDTGRGKKLFERYSFFIEDKERVAKRIDAFEKDRFMTPFDMNGDNVKKMAVFQYIIGNKDWFITTRHNIVIMQPKDTTQAPYTVPYDFDFSAFINADYTKPVGIPDEMLENRRIYKGICYTTDEFNEVFQFYRKLRPSFESLINNMEQLPKFSRKQCLRYIDEFFAVTESSKLFKQEFLDVCKTKKDYGILD